MKLFCHQPFSRISIDNSGDIWPACCPDWVEFPLGNIFTQNWDEIWYGEAAKKFRDSMYDGSLRHCNHNWCSYIADAVAGMESGVVVPHDKRPPEWVSRPPIHLNMNYDERCNLRCPSCRQDFIHYEGKSLKGVEYVHEYVETNILPMIESIALTGVGDPFYSPLFRDFLMNFDPQKYPNLKKIHFHTNGQLFDEKIYDKMKGIHHLKLSIDISIDAANSEVYSKLRPPGNWNRLIKNLQFIKGLDNLECLGISMVVQQENYKQMMAFVELGESLIHKDRFTFVEFKRITKKYDSMNQKDSALDEVAPLIKKDFLKRLHLIEKKRLSNAKKRTMPEIRHNLQEYLMSPEVSLSPLDRISSMISSISPSFGMMKWMDSE